MNLLHELSACCSSYLLLLLLNETDVIEKEILLIKKGFYKNLIHFDELETELSLWKNLNSRNIEKNLINPANFLEYFKKTRS